MVEAPQIGHEYWIITDIWEQNAAVPVTLVSEADGWYTGRWHITEEHTEDYECLEPRDLFHTQTDAWGSTIPRKGAGTIENWHNGLLGG